MLRHFKSLKLRLFKSLMLRLFEIANATLFLHPKKDVALSIGVAISTSYPPTQCYTVFLQHRPLSQVAYYLIDPIRNRSSHTIKHELIM